MSWFDRMVKHGLPLVPRAVVARVAQRYVAGETLDEAVDTVRLLEAEGAMFTLDLLGEEIEDAQTADATVDAYLGMLERIARDGLRGNVSVKLTALGLEIEEDLALRNLERLVSRAAELGNFVRIDMEDHGCTDATLRIYRTLRPRYDNVGVVLQAMLRRTPDDIGALLAERPNVRLCKGIYREPEEIAWQGYEEVRASFVRCLELLLDGGAYVGIATHDEVLIDAARRAVEHHGLARERYEMQMLHGVRPALRQQLIAEGHRLRVYVPYGADWYAYSLRRLRENPEVAKHVMKAMLHAG